jgi:hypothetical protein
MDAGIRAGFLLNPQETFYDVNNPPSMISYGDGSKYDKVGQEYPIIRPKEFKDRDFGVLPATLARFWSKQFSHFNAIDEHFDDVAQFLSVIKQEIKEKRPVLVLVRIIGSEGLPAFLPDPHLGLRTFFNTHWIVIVGFSEQGEGEWLIRDNGGLMGTVKYEPFGDSRLITISDASFKKIDNVDSLAEDVKLYLSEPDLPVFLEDPTLNDEQKELKEDFLKLKSFNLIRFAKK